MGITLIPVQMDLYKSMYLGPRHILYYLKLTVLTIAIRQKWMFIIDKYQFKHLNTMKGELKWT